MNIKFRSLPIFLLVAVFYVVNQHGIALETGTSQAATINAPSTKQSPWPVINIANAMRMSQLTVLKGRDSWIEDIAFDPSGKLLATAEHSGDVELWDMDTWKEYALIPLDPRGDIAFSVAFSPDGQNLAIASGSDIFLWIMSDIPVKDSNSKSAVIQGHKSYTGGLAFSPNGKVLASSDDGNSSEGGIIILWDLVKMKELARLKTEECYKAPDITFSPDNTEIASSTCDGFIHIWNQLLSKDMMSFKGNAPVEFNWTGTQLGFQGTDNTVRLLDAKTGREVGSLESDIFSPADPVTSIAFNPDGTILAAGTSGLGGIVLWDVATGKILTTLRSGGVTSLAFSPDGTLLISGHASAAGAFGDTNVWGIR